LAEFDEEFNGMFDYMEPTQFIAWVDAVFDKNKKNRPFKSAYRLNQSRLIKKYREEAVPLSWFLASNILQMQAVRLIATDKPADAEIKYGDETGFVEMTWPKDGHEDYLLNLYLNERGGVYTYYSGDVNTIKEALATGGKLKPSVFDVNEQNGEIVDNVTAILTRKESKTFPPNTFLLVVCKLFDEEDFGEVSNQIRNRISTQESKFKKIFLLEVESKRVEILKDRRVS